MRSVEYVELLHGFIRGKRAVRSVFLETRSVQNALIRIDASTAAKSHGDSPTRRFSDAIRPYSTNNLITAL